MGDGMLPVSEQLPLLNDADDHDDETKHCTSELSENNDLNTDTNFPKPQIINKDDMPGNVDADCSKNVDFEDEDETNREENENGFDSASGLLSVTSDDDIGFSKEAEISQEKDSIKSEFFENTHVVVLNKYNKFNARTKPKRSMLKHECDRCEEAFQFPYQLARHKSIKHEGKYPYFCDICEKPFDRSSSLRDHKLVHSENRPHECKQCGKTFKMIGNLKKHIRDLHTQNEEPKLVFQCEYCSKLFPTKERLTSHFIVHETEKAFACTVCGKKFNRKNNLKEHIVIHSTEKNYVCPDCGMRFRRKYSLKIHARNHMEVKPYKCELCPSSFSQLHALKTHFRLHTGEKPFKCNVCEKTFRQLATLQVHLKRHTGVKDFTCGICGKGFIIKRRLIEHERLHTGEKPFSCDICPYHTATSSGLRLHKKTHRRQMERLGIDSIEDLLTDGKQSISADGRKRKVSKKVKLPKQPVAVEKEESVQKQNVGTEICFEDKAVFENSCDMEDIKDKILLESESVATELTFLESGHVIEMVNDNTDPFTTAISPTNCSDDNNFDDNNDNSDDDNERITNAVKYCKKENSSPETVSREGHITEFENVATEVLYKYLNELIPVVDADLLTQKINSIIQELSESHTKLLRKISIKDSKLTKNTYDTNDKMNSNISGRTTSKCNNRHISAPATELSDLTSQSLPKSDPIIPKVIAVRNSPSVNVHNPPSLSVQNLSAVNVSSQSSQDFRHISKQTVNAGTKDQGPSKSYEKTSIFHSSTLRKMLASTEPMTTQGYVVRKEIKPVSTNTGSSFTVLKDMLSTPPQHYLTSTRNSAAALKHSIKIQNQITSSNRGFEGKWHTPDSSWSESNFTWIDEVECKPEIKKEPVSP